MIHTNMMTITHVSGLPACKITNNGNVRAVVPDSTKEELELEIPILLEKGSIGIEFIKKTPAKPIVIKLKGKSTSKSKYKKMFPFLDIS
jgi:hypothetical protein